MIKPTVGRRVWYWPGASDVDPNKTTPAMDVFVTAQPLDAGIVCVWGDRMVNLDVTDHGGIHHPRRSVTLLQDEDARPDNGSAFCEWMPYQQGQARAQAQVAAVERADMRAAGAQEQQRAAGAAEGGVDIDAAHKRFQTGYENVSGKEQP